jgi:hypothetical protein
MAESESKPIAVVIGVGPGLGASLARRFATKYAVAINARTPDFLRELVTDIREHTGVALEMQGDTSKPEEVQSAFELIRACTSVSATQMSSFLRRWGYGCRATIRQLSPRRWLAPPCYQGLSLGIPRPKRSPDITSTFAVRTRVKGPGLPHNRDESQRTAALVEMSRVSGALSPEKPARMRPFWVGSWRDA